jgi:hypothetical protein
VATREVDRCSIHLKLPFERHPTESAFGSNVTWMQHVSIIWWRAPIGLAKLMNQDGSSGVTAYTGRLRKLVFQIISAS